MRTIKEFLTLINEKRLEARNYPIYRIVERGVRVGIWAFISVAAVTLFDSDLSIKLALISAGASALDKMKNEYRKAFQDYDLNSFESLLSLFERD